MVWFNWLRRQDQVGWMRWSRRQESSRLSRTDSIESPVPTSDFNLFSHPNHFILPFVLFVLPHFTDASNLMAGDDLREELPEVLQQLQASDGSSSSAKPTWSELRSALAPLGLASGSSNGKAYTREEIATIITDEFLTPKQQMKARDLSSYQT